MPGTETPDPVRRNDPVRSGRPARRRPWFVRLILAALFVPPTGYFVYTRWTARPARPGPVDPRRWLNVPPPEVDATAELLKAMLTVTMPLPYSPPSTAPAGKQWVEMEAYLTNGRRVPPTPGARAPRTISLDTMLDGPWRPDDRHMLGALVAHVETPGISAALDRMVMLSGKPSCFPAAYTTASVSRVHPEAVDGLLGRARLRAESRDWDAAFQDASAAFAIMAEMADDGDAWWISLSAWRRTKAATGLAQLTQEHELDSGPARALLELLKTYRIDFDRLREDFLRNQLREVTVSADSMYTCDANGEGFRVFRDIHDPQVSWAAGALNLLSAFMDSRTQVLRQYAAANLREQLDFPPSCPNLSSVGSSASVNSGLERARAWYAAALITTALAAYRADHGQAAERLDQLVPTYLDSLAEATRAGLSYVCQNDGRYVLLDREGKPVPGPRSFRYLEYLLVDAP